MWLPDIESAPGWHEEMIDIRLYLFHGRRFMESWREIRKIARRLGRAEGLAVFEKMLTLDDE